jgi:hypothetical protein
MRARAMVAALAVVGGALAGAAPAAAVPGIQRVEAASATNGTSVKTVVVTCPAGTRVYNASGRINGGVGAVALDDITPNAALTSVTVTAYEITDDDNWSVIAYAMCGSAVLNLQRIEIDSATSSSTSKTVNPTCPGPTRLYGLGAEITGGLGHVVVDDLTPDAGLTGVRVTAYEVGAYPNNWTLTGYAICGNPVATMVRTAVSNPAPPAPPNAVSPKVAVTPDCPAGTSLHGGGGTITGGLGGVTLDDLTPSGALVDFTTTAYTIPGFSPSWRLTSYAICAS